MTHYCLDFRLRAAPKILMWLFKMSRLLNIDVLIHVFHRLILVRVEAVVGTAAALSRAKLPPS